MITVMAVICHFGGSICHAFPSGFHSKYYVKLEVKSKNTQFSGSNLQFAPAIDEFKADDFNTVLVTGVTDETENTYSNALDNAISEVLLKYGLQSVKTVSDNLNSEAREEIIVKYEGMVSLPVTVLRTWEHMDGETHVLAYDLKIKFSPIAYPDEWSYLYYKKEMIDNVKDFFSLIF